MPSFMILSMISVCRKGGALISTSEMPVTRFILLPASGLPGSSGSMSWLLSLMIAVTMVLASTSSPNVL